MILQACGNEDWLAGPFDGKAKEDSLIPNFSLCF